MTLTAKLNKLKEDVRDAQQDTDCGVVRYLRTRNIYLEALAAAYDSGQLIVKDTSWHDAIIANRERDEA